MTVQRISKTRYDKKSSIRRIQRRIIRKNGMNRKLTLIYRLVKNTLEIRNKREKNRDERT